MASVRIVKSRRVRTQFAETIRDRQPAALALDGKRDAGPVQRGAGRLEGQRADTVVNRHA